MTLRKFKVVLNMHVKSLKSHYGQQKKEDVIKMPVATQSANRMNLSEANDLRGLVQLNKVLTD